MKLQTRRLLHAGLASLCLLPVVSEAAQIKVNAYGTSAGGVYAHFRVLVNGAVVGEATTAATAKDYFFNTSHTRSQVREVAVQFDNDAAIGSDDRNLSVTAVTVDGRRTMSTASNVKYDRGALGGTDIQAGQVTMPWSGYLIYRFPVLTASGPIVRSNEELVVIRGVRVSNPNGDCIKISNAAKVIIEKSEIGPCAGVGILLHKVGEATVQQNFVGDLSTGALSGVYALESTKINVNHNQFLNMIGPEPRGQAVLFDKVKSAGNRVQYNYMETYAGANRLPEDTINIYQSEGTPQDKILVAHNFIRAGDGAASGSGCGINVGDSGSSYVHALNNVLINPGQVGICIPAGRYNRVENNRIYGKQQSFTNVGIYVQNRYAAATPPKPCSDHTITGNKVWWKHKEGYLNSWWVPSSGPTVCPNLTLGENFWDSTEVSETMAPPSGAGITNP